MTAEALPTSTVTAAAVSAVVAKVESRRRDRAGGVIGLRAFPEPTVAVMRPSPGGHPIHVEACPSTLAVWDAFHRWHGEGWLVILTDRPEDDLGAGTLAQLVDHRLITPDPWEAALQVFGARTLQRALITEGLQAELPTRLVALTPEDGWPSAPGGVLTREHAYASVAVKYLGLGLGVDAPGILEWTARHDAVNAVSKLRERAQDSLTDAVLGWLADQTGPASRAVFRLFERGRLSDILPSGLALHLLRNALSPWAEEAKIAEARLTERAWGSLSLRPDEVDALGTLCEVTVQELLARSSTTGLGRDILLSVDRMLREVSAASVARNSGFLPSALDAAYDRLGRAFADERESVEAAWEDVQNHPLARGLTEHPDFRRAPAHAGVRLVRWLTSVSKPEYADTLAGLARRQTVEDAWADAAINAAAGGVDSPELASGLQTVVEQALERRRRHDREFAKTLAAEGATTGRVLRDRDQGDGAVWRIEDLAKEVVVPIARERPTLVLLLDGMSTGAATQVLSSVTGRGADWTELAPSGSKHRASALAVLPSLTEHSRTSFFSGALTSGNQSAERAGFSETARAARREVGTLFHKAGLDTGRAGFELSPDVADAIGDVEKHGLVGCVLNTIDDALDRSDPSGTVWNDELVKHLRPLLAAAHRARRAVFITADHGHVVERRNGEKKAVASVSSARSRAADSPASEAEIEVSGPRVLSHDGTAILAVDEGVRYSNLRAGYHGGGSPAEVVVPVVVLIPTASLTEDPAGVAGWQAVPAQQPIWWNLARAGAPVATPEPAPATLGQGQFDFFEVPRSDQTVGTSVVATKQYADQQKIAGRVSLSDETVAGLLDALLNAGGQRITTSAVASLLRVPEHRVQFAAGQVQKLLNVEGYPVVRMDGGMLVLDAPLLAQQFGVAV